MEGIFELSCGAKFYRADLHMHSYGASYDVTDTDCTVQNIVDESLAQGLSIIAIADHNEIQNIAQAVAYGASKGLLVVPAVELSTPEGHLLCYAPNYHSLEKFFNRITVLNRGEKDSRCQTGTVECLNYLRAEGGFAVLAHIDLAGSFEENMPRPVPAKFDILCHDALLGFEIRKSSSDILYSRAETNVDRRNIAIERIRRLKLGSDQFLARVMNSDSHTLAAIGKNANNANRVTRFKMETASFEGLKLALMEADTRVRIEEEVPLQVPIIKGISFEGGFLDDQSIHFSPNLTCLIGGRGSGKSTIFEAVRLLGNFGDPEPGSVVDSDVWPESMGLLYFDETGQGHNLSRSKLGEIVNVDDPLLGSTYFPIEAYRQGETNTISKRIQDDPLALLNYLDRLIDVQALVEDAEKIEGELNELFREIVKARGNVSQIADAEKDLALKNSKVQKLKEEKGEEIISLQQSLESEKRARLAVVERLLELSGMTDQSDVLKTTKDIRNTIGAVTITLGSAEAAMIVKETDGYDASVNAVATSLKSVTADYETKVRAQIGFWASKEDTTAKEIERKKAEMLAAGIRLDMPFITRLTADQAAAAERLRVLKTWKPHLADLEAGYATLLADRWEARKSITNKRVSFASRATAALSGTMTDLFVSLKYDAGKLCPDGERLVIEAMGWKTLQQTKARPLFSELGVQILLQAVYDKNVDPISALKGKDDRPIFSSAEATLLIERISEQSLLSQLETVAVHDAPKLTITKKITEGGSDKYIPRDFKKLSLGQQQSVLLALMLASESKSPLIVDQPEDNLDGEFIYKTLVPAIRRAKERRQVIVVTHNANIAVLGDAEQIVVLRATHDKSIITSRGSIDDPATRSSTCAILEGSAEAFDRRAKIYGVGRE